MDVRKANAGPEDKAVIECWHNTLDENPDAVSNAGLTHNRRVVSSVTATGQGNVVKAAIPQAAASEF